MGKLDGKVAIVTGGGGNLGPFYARALGEEGASVVLADIVLEKAEAARADLASQGIDAIAVETDVGVQNSAKAAVATALNRFGRIDVLINNAGYAEPMDWEEISEAEWDKVMGANIKGCFMMAQAATPAMKSQGWGKIVNLTSAVFHLGPANLVHYVAAKSAVIGFTRSLANALGPNNITVNAVAPGLIATEPTIAIYPESYFDLHASRRALKRWGYPDDLVGTMMFLCTPDSDFMTGQTIVVDGGQVFS